MSNRISLKDAFTPSVIAQIKKLANSDTELKRHLDLGNYWEAICHVSNNSNGRFSNLVVKQADKFTSDIAKQ